MQYKKKIYTLLYIAAISASVATLVTYNLYGMSRTIKALLPIRIVRRIKMLLSANPVDFSELTISFIGILITVSIFTGIGLIFTRRRTNDQR